ncbi:MAG TPA: hypothetical protein VFE84_11130, partial [Patescibacteria group bacterium]|nr:hypothetical protein [Patescibacteria group bacterium]
MSQLNQASHRDRTGSAWSWIGILILLTVRVSLAPAAGETPGAAAPQPAVTGLIASSETEKPLAGARVEVFEQVDPDALRAKHASGEVLGDPVAGGAADSSGRFKINVPGGKRLIVVAEASGHQRSFLIQPVVLDKPGERDLGRLELPAGRRVTGKVTDAAGKPLPAARVIGMVPRPQAR